MSIFRQRSKSALKPCEMGVFPPYIDRDTVFSRKPLIYKTFSESGS